MREGSYLRTVPSAEAGSSGRSGRSRVAEQVRRGGYRSALRPIVSLPRRSRRSRAREPGSSPARHLLPPLWKRPPPPKAARPGPRLRAAGPARLTGRCQPLPMGPRPPPSWRGTGGPFPAARARRSRAPAVRAPAGRGGARPELQVEARVPGRPSTGSEVLRLGGRRWKPGRRAGLRGNARKRHIRVSDRRVKRMAETWGEVNRVGDRSVVPRARPARFPFLDQLLTRCQTLDTLIFSMPQFLHL
ncbi:uncharacterized protein LOC134381055 [Cynocephalus volans]|uniref:uncharacterized protein LOC134381055 n=1 Tax=Cynocephalus volans TaxID=110931 RepID=UPI002FC6951D